ncbi:MAG: RHS repeat-associated core domain-containing protein [Flavobacteriaceae bacterium]|nr:RHS repeat-associated core domain-containing protein [Flavobacteriaceae bacterium]
MLWMKIQLLGTASLIGQTITLQYDEWGRKTSMLDPSVSSTPFTYQYTNFDEIYKEITPSEDYIITYLGTPYDAAIIKITKYSGTTITYDDYHYLHRDFQGSIMAISDAVGAVKERRHFDPWGNIVKVTDANGVTKDSNAKLLLLHRGYTGHEHFTEVGIIHMNGRIYDPVLKTFLSPDNFIQDPNNSQSYNRYGYAWNNPLKYNDPSGEIFGLTAVASAVVIGAFIGGATYTLSALLITHQFTPLGFAKSIFIGGVSGVFAYGVGEMAQVMFEVGKNAVLVGAFQAVSHAYYNGFMTAIEGGNFLTGALAGAAGSAAGSLSATAQMNTASSLLFGSFVSGMTAKLTGGTFWQGAAIGLTVSLLNHAAHAAFERPPNGYEKDGKGGYRKINDNGGDEIDYLYENGEIIEARAVISYTGEVPMFGLADIADPWQSTYGYRFNQQSPHLYDPTGDVIYGMFGGGLELKAGWSLLRMSLSNSLKQSIGLKVLGGASTTTLNSSIYFKNIFGSGDWINILGMKSLPTIFGKANTWSTFFGRNSILFGPALMLDGGRRIYNSFNK